MAIYPGENNGTYPNELARWALQASHEAAMETRAHRRAQIIEQNEDQTYKVKAGSAELNVSAERAFDETYVADEWVTLTLTDGMYSITGRSAFSGGAGSG